MNDFEFVSFGLLTKAEKERTRKRDAQAFDDMCNRFLNFLNRGSENEI